LFDVQTFVVVVVVVDKLPDDGTLVLKHVDIGT
jgi:hypothetical protein